MGHAMKPGGGRTRLRVLHLVGSPTSDFFAELSLLYARDCLAATADADRYEVLIAHVEPGGRWRFPAGLSDVEIADAPAVPVADAVARLTAERPDVVVPQMFCLPGMTHHRALLDLLGLPYVGNRPEVMALTADKARARAVVAAAGVAVPDGEVVRRGGLPTLPLPVVVKPVDADNSHGLSLVRDAADLEAALATALEHSDRVLVERYVELGREVRCGVVVRDGVATALPLEEYAVDAIDKPVRDAADKLAVGEDGAMRLVAKDTSHAWLVHVDDPATAPVQAAALACHEALGARHHSLFDFRLDPEGRPWFLEAGMYCSYAEKSVVAVMARAAGITLPDLFADGLAQAMEESR